MKLALKADLIPKETDNKEYYLSYMVALHQQIPWGAGMWIKFVYDGFTEEWKETVPVDIKKMISLFMKYQRQNIEGLRRENTDE